MKFIAIMRWIEPIEEWRLLHPKTLVHLQEYPLYDCALIRSIEEKEKLLRGEDNLVEVHVKNRGVVKRKKINENRSDQEKLIS